MTTARSRIKETMMRCEHCHQADLRPAAFVYERKMPGGTVVRREVEGFECPNCNDRVLLSRDAGEISREWLEAERASRPAPTRS